MNEIIETLKEFSANIKCDIRSDWATPEEKSKFMVQSMQIDMAIGLLSQVGYNPNI